MYVDFQLYNPFVAGQMVNRPSGVNSMQLFQMISMALDRNLNDYHKKKNQEMSKNEGSTCANLVQPKLAKTIVIDSQSDQQLDKQPFQNEKEVHLNIAKNPVVQQTLVESSQKDEMVDSFEQEIVSQSVSRQTKQKNVKEKEEFSANVLSSQNLKRPSLCSDFVQFTINVPKLGLTNSELARKKQKLLRRNISDWSDLDNKGGKQRREIRMLKN